MIGGPLGPEENAKTSRIVLLIRRLAARGEPLGDRVPKQWQWPLSTRGA